MIPFCLYFLPIESCDTGHLIPFDMKLKIFRDNLLYHVFTTVKFLQIVVLVVS